MIWSIQIEKCCNQTAPSSPKFFCKKIHKKTGKNNTQNHHCFRRNQSIHEKGKETTDIIGKRCIKIKNWITEIIAEIGNETYRKETIIKCLFHFKNSRDLCIVMYWKKPGNKKRL